ncbi:MAG: hypothetical protein Q7J36_16085 [Thiobacillus sp.]|nr:hypothetical protein [Thiobacillus sp.]
MSSAPDTGSDGPPVVSYTSPGRTCPRCKGPAVRVPRRLVDLLLSMFVTVGRFRCIAEDCGWEGRMRVKPHPLLVQGPW